MPPLMHHPPRLAQKVLRHLLLEEEIHEKLGDFEEGFHLMSAVLQRPATLPAIGGNLATDVSSSLTLGLVASKDQPQGGAHELEPAPYLIHQVALIREMHQPLVIDKDDKSGGTDAHLSAIVQA